MQLVDAVARSGGNTAECIFHHWCDAGRIHGRQTMERHVGVVLELEYEPWCPPYAAARKFGDPFDVEDIGPPRSSSQDELAEALSMTGRHICIHTLGIRQHHRPELGDDVTFDCVSVSELVRTEVITPVAGDSLSLAPLAVPALTNPVAAEDADSDDEGQGKTALERLLAGCGWLDEVQSELVEDITVEARIQEGLAQQISII